MGITFHSAPALDVPEICGRAVELLTETFGSDEGEMERYQLSGAESAYNSDYLFWAENGGAFAGMCHLTFCPSTGLGGLSGVCVRPEFRRQGIADTLLSAATRCFDDLGGKCIFLGTGNPSAADLYRQHGFAFDHGSNVMYRTQSLSLRGLYRDAVPGEIAPADPSLRLGIIPLALCRGNSVLKDANVRIADSCTFTQQSCMSLYPRFADLSANGGNVLVVRDNSGCLPIAVGTLAVIEGKTFVDAFGINSIPDSALAGLILRLADHRPVCARVSATDLQKQHFFESLGFHFVGNCTISVNSIPIACSLLSRA